MAATGLAIPAFGATTINYATPAVNGETAAGSTAGSAVISIADGTKYAVGDIIRFSGTSASTNPFGTSATSYYIVGVSGNTIQVSTTPGGTALAATNTTSATTTFQGQDWFTAANWTGGVVPNTNSVIANFGSGFGTNVPALTINGNATVYGLNFNGSGSSDLALASGANGTGLYTLTFATNDATTPVVTQGTGTTRLINFGQANFKLALAGNQGLIINSLAGGAVSGSGLAATSTASTKNMRFTNVDYANFSGGIIVQRGELSMQATNQLGSGSTVQSLTVGNAQTLTNNLLAGLSMASGTTVDALNGNNLGRVWGGATLTVGSLNGTGDFGGVIGRDFTGTTTATNLTKSGSGTETISGIMAGTGNVTVNGASGTLIFSNSGNSYTGSTTVTNGTLRGTVSKAFGSTSGISIGASGTLDLRGDANTIFGNGTTNYPVSTSAAGAKINVDQITAAGVGQTLTIGTLGIGNAGTAHGLTVTGANNTGLSTGAVTLTGAADQKITNNIGGGGALTVASVAEGDASSRTFTFDGSGNTTVSGAISQNAANALALTYGGSGTLTLNGDSSTGSGYAGVTTIASGGTVKLGNAGALGTTAAGTTISSGGTLDLNGQAISEVLSPAGSGVGGNGAIVNSNTSVAATVNSESTNGTSFTVGGAGNLTLQRARSGGSPFVVTKTGAGTLTLGNANTTTNMNLLAVDVESASIVNFGISSGNFIVADRGVKINAGGTVNYTGSSTNFITDNSEVIVSNGTLNVNALNDTIGKLTIGNGTNNITIGGTGTLTISSTYNLFGTSTSGGSSSIEAQSGTVNAKLAGTGIVLNKTTGGTVSLNGNNTYTGGTNVQAGTLRVNNATGSTGSGTVTVGSADGTQTATLGGNGVIANGSNAVTINPGSTVTAGVDDSTTGMLTTGTQVWKSGAQYRWKIANPTGSAGTTGGWDQLVMSSVDVSALSAGVGGQFTIQAIATGALTLVSGDSFQIATYTGTTGTPAAGLFALDVSQLLAATTNDDSASNYGLNFGSGSISISYSDTQAAPEPTTALLAAVSGTALLGRRRRRIRVAG